MRTASEVCSKDFGEQREIHVLGRGLTECTAARARHLVECYISTAYLTHKTAERGFDGYQDGAASSTEEKKTVAVLPGQKTETATCPFSSCTVCC